MSLVELWRASRGQLEDKSFGQIITFAGDGKLRDGGKAAEELRAFLPLISASHLKRYAFECLEGFQDSGLGLQEVVNEIGRRLGFDVTHGRYRGIKGTIGFDGLWIIGRHSIVVEVKTTDAYRLDLNTVASYRKRLAESGQIKLESSSVLIVCGREDTGDLEAQIRGSQHAWDFRLISVKALSSLMELKEELEDPAMIAKVHDILVPREYTKLDQIVELVFSAAEDVRKSDVADLVDIEADRKVMPAAFHPDCIGRISKHLGCDFYRKSRATFASADDRLRLVCIVSTVYTGGRNEGFWFAFHPHQKDFLESAGQGYVGLGCGSTDGLLLFTISEFAQLLGDFNQTQRLDRFYWHVRVNKQSGRYLLLRSGKDALDVTAQLLK